MLANIDDILSNRTIESSRIEYKEDWNPERVLHTMCAFANDIENIGGGYIILGISEKDGMPELPPKGIDRDKIDRIDKELMGMCNLMEPRYIPTTAHVDIDGRDIFVIEVLVGQERPYKCPDSLTKDKSKRTGKSYYIRRLANTIVANSDDERILFSISSNIPFDCRVNYKANLNDIRPSLIHEYLAKTDSDRPIGADRTLMELCKDLKIVGEPPYEDKPLNIGLMFFNERPQTFFEYARIEIVDMPDPTGDGMVELTMEGPLDIQLEKAVGYIKSNVVKVMTNKDPDTPIAERVSNYPLAAIEEAITNAVYHRDYSIPEPITVTIRPEGIEVMSFPGPDRSISDRDIADCRMSSSRYRNARIGDLLKHRRLAEKRGTGVPLILRSLRNNGSADPVFETDPERTFLKVIIPVHERFLHVEDEGYKKKRSGVRRSADELRHDILEALSDRGSMSMRELAEELGYSRSARNLYERVRELVESGKIEYTVDDRRSSRNQRIRIRI